MQMILWTYATSNPTEHLEYFVNVLKEHHFDCSKEVVRNIFKRWRWSWKRPQYFQINKYSKKNMEYYGDFMEWINRQDRRKLKFMDEVHFVEKGKLLKNLIVDLITVIDLNQSNAIGPIGVRTIVVRNVNLSNSFSVSCLVRLHETSPVFISGRKESNNQFDFVR